MSALPISIPGETPLQRAFKLPLSQTARIIYSYLNDLEAHGFSCDLPVTSIAEACGVGQRSAYRAMAELSRFGLLKTHTQEKRAKVIAMPNRPANLASDNSDNPAILATREPAILAEDQPDPAILAVDDPANLASPANMASTTDEWCKESTKEIFVTPSSNILFIKPPKVPLTEIQTPEADHPHADLLDADADAMPITDWLKAAYRRYRGAKLDNLASKSKQHLAARAQSLDSEHGNAFRLAVLKYLDTEGDVWLVDNHFPLHWFLDRVSRYLDSATPRRVTKPAPPRVVEIPTVKPGCPPANRQEKSDIQGLADRWNATTGLPYASAIKPGYRTYNTAMRLASDAEFLANFDAMLDKAKRLHDARRERGGLGWLTLEWLMKDEDNWHKLLGTNYDDILIPEEYRGMTQAEREEAIEEERHQRIKNQYGWL